jgi:chitinase
VVPEAESLADLRERSQALEALLAAMPERPAVERAGTSVPIESLQSQVQWLDHQLSLAGADGRSAESEQLWRDRVEVMNSLVQLRAVEAQLVAL